MDGSKVRKSPAAEPGPSRIAAVELAVSKMLRIGIYLAAAVIIVGLLWLLITGEGGYPEDTYPTSFMGIVNGVGDWKPVAVIEAGLLLLILTPVLRVVVSLFVFLREKDYRFVAITALVLLILIISFALGKAG